MKRFFRNILLGITLFITAPVFATVDSIIDNSAFNHNSLICVSVKDVKNSEILYQKNQDKLILPASTLKIFTAMAMLDTLGKNYTFDTATYKDSKNNLYIKLSANPVFTTKDLKDLINQTKSVSKLTYYKNIYIDDRIVDSYNWGIGWAVDDLTNSDTPLFGAYNLDRNVINLEIDIDSKTSKINVVQKNAYRMNYVNMLKKGDKTEITPIRKNRILYLAGTVAADTKLSIPVDNLSEYFLTQLRLTLKKAGIKYDNISFAKVPTGAKKIYVHKQDLDQILEMILKNSDNCAAETVFKLAGGGYKGGQGTLVGAVDMFRDYYDDEKMSLLTDEILIVDGSGVSRNNMLTADWASEALVYIAKSEDFDYFKKKLAKPAEGTLKGRLVDLEEVLRAKTGTLSGISGIVGYLTTKKGNKLVFSIYIQNFKYQKKYAKQLEDKIITELYTAY